MVAGSRTQQGAERASKKLERVEHRRAAARKQVVRPHARLPRDAGARGFEYILYKYGPFSRDLHAELASMRADGFLRLVPQEQPYGPTLQVTDVARHQLVERWPKTLERYRRQLEFVAKKLGGLGVGELEKLATALWVRETKTSASTDEHAERVNDLKPHLSKDQALDALRRAEEMEQEASGLVVT